MYKRILIPLDGSSEAEGVIPMVKGELSADGEMILLRVIPPGRTQTIGGQVMLGSQQEEAETEKAKAYLRSVPRRIEGMPEQCRWQVTVASNIAQGIVDFARQWDVGLIAMYTHERKGLSGLMKKSIAKDVQKHASVEVKVFKPQELAVVS